MRRFPFAEWLARFSLNVTWVPVPAGETKTQWPALECRSIFPMSDSVIALRVVRMCLIPEHQRRRPRGKAGCGLRRTATLLWSASLGFGLDSMYISSPLVNHCIPLGLPPMCLALPQLVAHRMFYHNLTIRSSLTVPRHRSKKDFRSFIMLEQVDTHLGRRVLKGALPLSVSSPTLPLHIESQHADQTPFPS